MKIYLIRHGETDWNHELRFQGREDIPLNKAGIGQAEACGAALADAGLQAVYASPLKRAELTGKIIAEKAGLDENRVYMIPELIERDLGRYSGRYIADGADYFALSAGQDMEGMEPFKEVLRRMELAIYKILQSGFSSVAAVSHGAAINVLLSGLSDNAVGTGKTRLYNGGISILEGDAENGVRITACNIKPEDL